MCILSINLQSAIASGVFQLKVESLNMTKELSRQDVLRLRICWSHFQREINADNVSIPVYENCSTKSLISIRQVKTREIKAEDIIWLTLSYSFLFK